MTGRTQTEFGVLRSHPAFARCLMIYTNAVIDWHGSPAVQDAAHTLGMTARAYADSRIYANQFSWASSSTTEEFSQAHYDLAYQDAVNKVCGVEA